MIARRQVEIGADLIVVPICTDTHAGHYRVQTGSRARALENQCFVVTAPVVGIAAWSKAMDINVGAAGVFTPIDYGFPSDGVLATGAMNEPMWLLAELDLAEIARVRQTGQVYNYRDWPRQFNAPATDALAVPEPGWLVPALMTPVARARRDALVAAEPAHGTSADAAAEDQSPSEAGIGTKTRGSHVGEDLPA